MAVLWQFGKTIHPTAKVFEEVNLNRKCHPRNTTTVQLSTLYADHERQNGQRHRRTDGRTDIVMTV